MKKSPKLPEFHSIDEIADFWQTHSLTDYEDQWEEVIEGPIVGSDLEKKELWVNVKPREAKAVRRIAKAKHVGELPLVRRWIEEGIRRETAGKRR